MDVMSNERGEQLHKAEQLEIDFVKSQGGTPNYNDIENHISNIADIFYNSDDDEDEREDIEFMKEDFQSCIDDAVETIGDMYDDLTSRLNELVEDSDEDSPSVKSLKCLLDYIDDRRTDAIEHLKGII